MKQRDTITSLGRSLIQYGPFSDRVYIMRLDPSDLPDIVEKVEHLATKCGYSKIFVKVPEPLAGPFHQGGFTVEAFAPDMYPSANGAKRDPGLFLSKFLGDWRAREDKPEQALQVLRVTTRKAMHGIPTTLPEDWRMERLGPEHAEEMAHLYREAFPTYPFPIDDPAYLHEIMNDNAHFYGARKGDALVALSSCETDKVNGFVEMTDFAARTEARGAGAAYHLLGMMEQDMREQGFHMAFSISRALSVPINVSFARQRYFFCGSLVRNTNICGALESMNVWCKTL